MTDNLTQHNDTPLGDEAYAAAQRLTAIGLAGVALRLAAGDEDTAREMLRGPLEAIGVLPYASAAGDHSYGRAP